MNISLNGKTVDVPAGLTIAELIAWRKLNPETIIVEYNYNLVRPECWSEIVLKENDRLEILRFVEGG